MNPWMFAVAATALATERIVYAIAWLRPERFIRFCHQAAPDSDPVDVLARLFVVFKAIQALIFVAWVLAHGGTFVPVTAGPSILAAAVALILLGQLLNLSVFARLGVSGVFYGTRLGHDVAWCDGFPFSIVRHPQYVGTVLSIWGLFLAMRYPAPDWVVLPVLQTLYYAVGAVIEQAPSASGVTPPVLHPATAPDQPEPASLL